jgi:hypothetical protein
MKPNQHKFFLYDVIISLCHLFIISYLIGYELIYWELFESASIFVFWDDYMTLAIIIYFSITGLLLFKNRFKLRLEIYRSEKTRNDIIDDIVEIEYTTQNASIYLIVNNFIYGILIIAYVLVLFFFNTALLLELDKPIDIILYPVFIAFGFSQCIYSFIIYRKERAKT